MRSCQQCGLRYTAEDEFCHADGAKLIESDDELLGETIGNYRIVRLLGEGGMGRVYLGLHPRIGSRVAVKLLSPLASVDDELVERFFAEAELVNKIRHEGIVNVLDLDHLPDGRPFITMEYLDGEPLSSTIAKGPMALGMAATIGIEILEALQAAHKCGVVHRDLKPDNIFISPKGRVKLLDFGIAKLMPEFQTSAIGPATRTGSLLGTPGYMAPEQVVGDPVSGATDLYAVGAILYEALTGTMAFSGTTLFELLRRIVSDPPRTPVERRPDLAGPFEALILRALSKKPEERFATAQEMARDLDAIRSKLGPDAWAPLAGPELRVTDRQAIAIGSEATLLPGDQRLALGSEATLLQDSALQQSPPQSTMPSGSSALRAVSGAPGTGATLGLESSEALGSKNTSYSAQTHSTRSNKLWTLWLVALGAVGAVLAIVVLQSGASSKSEASAQATVSDAALSIHDGGAAVVASKPTADSQSSSDGGTAVVAMESPRPAGPPLHSGKRPVKRSDPSPTASVTSSVETAPTPLSPAPDAGTKPAKGSITTIETGDRHPKSTIRKAPDYNPKAFDAVAYLPKARKLAKQIYSDAILVEFDVEGVGANGKSNLALANFKTTYNFLSRSHSKRTMPIGVDEDIPCWVDVEVGKNGVVAEIVEREECKGKARPNPKCSMRAVWKRSDSLGTSKAKAGALAHISYLWDGWFFDIDALDLTGSINDDC